MARASLERLINDWFLDELYSGPERDPRSGPECLTVPEMAAVAQRELVLPASRLAHVGRCAFCASASGFR